MILPLRGGKRLYARLGEHGYRWIVIGPPLLAALMLIVNGISKPG